MKMIKWDGFVMYLCTISPHYEQWLTNQNAFSKGIFLSNAGSHSLQNTWASIFYETRDSVPISVYWSWVELSASDAHGACTPPDTRPGTVTPEVPATREGGSYILVPIRKTGTITCFTSKTCWSLKLDWISTADLW